MEFGQKIWYYDQDTRQYKEGRFCRYDNNENTMAVIQRDFEIGTEDAISFPLRLIQRRKPK